MIIANGTQQHSHRTNVPTRSITTATKAPRTVITANGTQQHCPPHQRANQTDHDRNGQCEP